MYFVSDGAELKCSVPFKWFCWHRNKMRTFFVRSQYISWMQCGYKIVRSHFAAQQQIANYAERLFFCHQILKFISWQMCLWELVLSFFARLCIRSCPFCSDNCSPLRCQSQISLINILIHYLVIWTMNIEYRNIGWWYRAMFLPHNSTKFVHECLLSFLILHRFHTSPSHPPSTVHAFIMMKMSYRCFTMENCDYPIWWSRETVRDPCMCIPYVCMCAWVRCGRWSHPAIYGCSLNMFGMPQTQDAR